MIMGGAVSAVRAGVSKQLAVKYKFKQAEIAVRLGITQAAVSKYLSGFYSHKVKTIEENPRVQRAIKKIAASIASSKTKKNKLVQQILKTSTASA